MELNRGCYSFGVLRDFFLVHMNHPMVAREDKHDQTESNRGHWQKFRAYLNVRYKQACNVLPPPNPLSFHDAKVFTASRVNRTFFEGDDDE